MVFFSPTKHNTHNNLQMHSRAHPPERHPKRWAHVLARDSLDCLGHLTWHRAHLCRKLANAGMRVRGTTDAHLTTLTPGRGKGWSKKANDSSNNGDCCRSKAVGACIGKGLRGRGGRRRRTVWDRGPRPWATPPPTASGQWQGAEGSAETSKITFVPEGNSWEKMAQWIPTFPFFGRGNKAQHIRSASVTNEGSNANALNVRKHPKNTVPEGGGGPPPP